MNMSTSENCDRINRCLRKNACGGISGIALVAAPRRGLQAQLAVEGPHELAVVVADREVLVQRVDDRNVGQQAPRQAEQLGADEQGVLHVDHVGALSAEHLGEPVRVDTLVPRRHEELVELLVFDQHDGLVGVALDRAHLLARAQAQFCCGLGPTRATSIGSQSGERWSAS